MTMAKAQAIKDTHNMSVPVFNALLRPEEYQEKFKAAAEKERRDFKRNLRERFSKCGADKKDIEDAGFDRWKNPERNMANEELLRLSDNFLQKMQKGECKNFVLFGESGKSKTYTALSILKAWMMKTVRPSEARFPKVYDCNGEQITDIGVKIFHSGLYVRSVDLVNLVLNKRTVTTSERGRNTDLYLEYEKCELLIIDEVGRLMPGVKKSDEQQVLFQIIDYRINHFLPVVLCTNYRDLETIKAEFGDALYNRLCSWSVFFNCTPCTNFRKPEIQRTLRARKTG